MICSRSNGEMSSYSLRNQFGYRSDEDNTRIKVAMRPASSCACQLNDHRVRLQPVSRSATIDPNPLFVHPPQTPSDLLPAALLKENQQEEAASQSQVLCCCKEHVRNRWIN